MIQSQLREELEYYREIHPVNCRDLARLIGISTTTLIRFEKGADLRVDAWKKINNFIEKAFDHESLRAES